MILGVNDFEAMQTRHFNKVSEHRFTEECREPITDNTSTPEYDYTRFECGYFVWTPRYA
jgi:hypothetical protein